MNFSYGSMVSRNLGFVDEAEQKKLAETAVFICGTGGMGGAALQSLVRAGICQFEIADFDIFEVSNLNRQVFATLDALGEGKVEASKKALLNINPHCEIRTYGSDWTEKLDEILDRCKIVVNGMDDIVAGIHLYRRAKVKNATVIDAYTSPLPSVTSVCPDAPRPEERLGYPTVGVPLQEITDKMVQTCKLRELEYVLIHSSSITAIHLGIASEVFAGQRPRMSFAPMVITTGNLMAFEVIRVILGRDNKGMEKGYFFNPWKIRVERHRNPIIAFFMKYAVRLFLRRFLKQEAQSC